MADFSYRHFIREQMVCLGEHSRLQQYVSYDYIVVCTCGDSFKAETTDHAWLLWFNHKTTEVMRDAGRD